ncbi:hypothetical protein THAOC_11532, partial [Thalassiosira oceanica]
HCVVLKVLLTSAASPSTLTLIAAEAKKGARLARAPGGPSAGGGRRQWNGQAGAGPQGWARRFGCATAIAGRVPERGRSPAAGSGDAAARGPGDWDCPKARGPGDWDCPEARLARGPVRRGAGAGNPTSDPDGEIY